MISSSPVAAAFIPAAPGWAGLNRANAGWGGSAVITATLAALSSMSLSRGGERLVHRLVGFAIVDQPAELGPQPMLNINRDREKGRDEQQGQRGREEQAADHRHAHRR